MSARGRAVLALAEAGPGARAPDHANTPACNTSRVQVCGRRCDKRGHERSRKLIDRRLDGWANELVEEGYVVLFPEDFRDTCRKTKRTPAIVRAVHAMKAAQWLDAQEDIDPKRIALLGLQ